MELTWHPATLKDIKLLTKVRIDILCAEQNENSSADMSDILVQTYDYYKEKLQSDLHTSYLVFDGDEVAGTGDLTITRVLPTLDNQTGYQAHIMNLYTHPDYRRQGIAYRTLALLLADAKKRGISVIGLESTEMSRPLFEKFGFVGADHMLLQDIVTPAEAEEAPEQPFEGLCALSADSEAEVQE